jgi:hypothetical protein
MNKCIKCGGYAFNLYKEGIDQGGLCDVHYWQGRAHRAEAQRQWVGLTDDEVNELAAAMVKRDQSANWLAVAIEFILKEKNT